MSLPLKIQEPSLFKVERPYFDLNLLAPKLIRVLRFIEHSYQEKIQMDELAAIVNMSPSALLRAFSKEMKETPINYLINLRLEKAAKMLRETPKSITQISYSVGFHDSNYFSKMFRRKYSCSPREYKITNKGK